MVPRAHSEVWRGPHEEQSTKDKRGEKSHDTQGASGERHINQRFGRKIPRTSQPHWQMEKTAF